MTTLIAIVEDDRQYRESLRRLLQTLDFKVVSFSSAIDFLTSDALNDTSCLIVDFHMPGVTGLGLHRKLVEMGRSIPLILMTADPDKALRTRALSEGVIGFFAKPIGEADIVQCLHNIFGSSPKTSPRA